LFIAIWIVFSYFVSDILHVKDFRCNCSDTMKNTLTRITVLVISATISALIFQSCTASNDIQPLHLAPNVITIKAGDMSDTASQQMLRHLLISSQSAQKTVILDTMIRGNCSYSFVCTQANIAIKASLTAQLPFTCSLEIDRNHVLDAFNHSSCNSTSFDIADQISF